MIGTKLAHYEITTHLGSGGMGDVYQATDSRLGRSVAIKFLPEAFSHDSERVARFEREARVLALLNHSNIAAIHGLEEFGERKFLVMELVEGETLAERIKRGPIPVDESLTIAKQMCEALEAAHEKGVIHRDLKPANVKITPEGKVKVLDFGLAKAFENESANAALPNSPTLSIAATNAGVILGTAAYMSPEQAKGMQVDRRTDIFSFGAVLYQMLSGTQVFQGDSMSDILAAVLKVEPDWSRLPKETPAAVRRLLRRCLQKDRSRRIQTATDVRIEIEESNIEPEASVPAITAAASPRGWQGLLVPALVFVTLIAVVVAVRRSRPAPDAPETRTEINTPPAANPASLAISPDGKKIVFVAITEGRSQLLLRSLDAISARPLAGTEDASWPFWSPDSRSIGFFAGSNLKRIDIDGGSVEILARTNNPAGGSWSRDGVILFAPSYIGPISRVSAAGGAPAVVTRLTVGQGGHRFPQFLSDGRHFLYSVVGAADVRGIYIAQLDGPETRRLLDADAATVFAPSEYLLFVRQGTLYAQNFDAARLELSGNPVPVAEQVLTLTQPGLSALSVSATGTIIYRTGTAVAAQRQFIWFDRSGKEIERVGSFATAQWSLSPDGHRLAMTLAVNGNADVWQLDIARGVRSRSTFDAAVDNQPVWSADGSRIVFSSNRKGVADLFQKPAAGAGTEELLLATTQIKNATDWSPDGHFLLYRSNDPKTQFDLWALPLSGDRKPLVVVQTNFNERDAQFSPDGKWIAYESDESGRYEIYVQPFPGPGNKVQISADGGMQVRWRRDGKELFYVAADGRLMSVPIQFTSNGTIVEAGSPVPLFMTRIPPPVQNIAKQQYAVSPDGQRFLMNTIEEETAASPITILQNWKPPAK